MEAARSGGGGKELLLPATRDLWNSLEDFKLQVVMMIIMRIVVIIMIMMDLWNSLVDFKLQVMLIIMMVAGLLVIMIIIRIIKMTMTQEHNNVSGDILTVL